MQTLLAIQELCARLDRGSMSRPEFADRCSALIAARVGCSAAAVWLLLDSVEGKVVQPLGHPLGSLRWGLNRLDRCGPFAASLEAQGSVIAQEARLHAATAGFFAAGLPASPVRSMLAVPFSVNGELFGAFVCAQFDQPLRWSAAQLAALRQMSLGITPPLARATSFTMSARPADPRFIPWRVRTTETVFGGEIV